MFHVRWTIRLDLPDLVAMESCTADGWTEGDFNTHLSKRNTLGMTLEYQDRVVGFMVYSLNAGCIELVRLNDGYNEHFGNELLGKLESKLSSDRRTYAAFNAPETDLPLQLLLRSRGWRAVGIVGETYRFVYHLCDQPALAVDATSSHCDS